MKFSISTHDGKIRAHVNAPNLDAALDEVAQDLGCADFEDMCKTLNYVGSDFRVARIVEQDEAPAADDDRKPLLQKMARSALEAFKRERQ